MSARNLHTRLDIKNPKPELTSCFFPVRSLKKLPDFPGRSERGRLLHLRVAVYAVIRCGSLFLRCDDLRSGGAVSAYRARGSGLFASGDGSGASGGSLCIGQGCGLAGLVRAFRGADGDGWAVADAVFGSVRWWALRSGRRRGWCGRRSVRCFASLSGAVMRSAVVSVRWLRCGWRLFWWSLSVLFCV